MLTSKCGPRELRLLIEYEQDFKSPADPLEEPSGDGRGSNSTAKCNSKLPHGARSEAGGRHARAVPWLAGGLMARGLGMR